MLLEIEANPLQIQEYQEENARLKNSWSAIEKRETKKNHMTMLNWLSAVDVILDQEVTSAVRQTDGVTGDWILSEKKVHAWMDPANNLVRMLWLKGIPGAGKNEFACQCENILIKFREDNLDLSYHR
jgi:hypothetical protein